MIRILSLLTAVATLSLASCATKGGSCCSKPGASAEKSCCKDAKAKGKTCATCSH